MTSKSGRQQPKERTPRPSACVVCGDPAIGYNYNAASCAPCKAFFRRYVVKKHLLTCCQKKGICARETSLKPCQKCRYDKCIAGGMKPELVASTVISKPAHLKGRTLSVDETPSSSSVSDDSRLSKDSSETASVDCQRNSDYDPDNGAPCDPTPSTSRQANNVQIVANPFRIESKMEVLMLNLTSLEAAHRKLRISTFTTRVTPALCIADLAFGRSQLGGNFEFHTQRVFAYIDHFQQMYSPALDPFSGTLFPIEMLIKTRAVIDLTDFDFKTRKLWVFQDIICTIEFMKAMPIYQLMDDSSKEVLAASALVCTNLMVAYYSYTHNSDRTIFPDGSVVTWTADIQDQAPGSTRFHTVLIAALREVNIDDREFSLLKNILICNPVLEGLQEYDSILLQHEKERYTKTLLSYVMATTGVEEGPARFVRILSIADIASRITSWQKSEYITSFALGLAKPMTPFGLSIFHSP